MTFDEAVQRLRQIDQRETDAAWEMGDIALAMVPMGTDGVKNGARDKVRVLAEAAGVSPDLLHQRRYVSHTFPAFTRVNAVSWSVYREIGNIGNQEERDRLVGLLTSEEPGTKHGRWTVVAIRARMNPRDTSAAILGPPPSIPPPGGKLKPKPVTKAQVDDLKEVQVARHDYLEQKLEAKVPGWSRQTTRLEALEGHLDLEQGMEAFVATVQRHLPVLARDPELATKSEALRSLVQRCQEALDQVRRLVSTGKSTDEDTFVRRLLAEDPSN